MASKRRDTSDISGRVPGPDIRPLNARSLALSALLGTHPPALPGSRLVALAELFGIAGGTMRTALSRMAAAGELEANGGSYRLVGRLLARQRAQDAGRRPPPLDWDGTWHTAIALDGRRDLDARRRARQVLADHRFGELRPDIWMRPANLPPPDLDDAWTLVSGPASRPAAELVPRFWDLELLATAAADLRRRLGEASEQLDELGHAAIPPAFHVSASVVRFLKTEPMLPGRLVPPGWPVVELRREYDRVEATLLSALQAFYADA